MVGPNPGFDLPRRPSGLPVLLSETMSFQLLIGAVTAVTLFVNVLIHEPGHSVVGLRYKIPVRSIAPFLFGGVAQIGEEPPSAIAEFLIASAGPSIGDKMLAVFRHHFKPSAGSRQ